MNYESIDLKDARRYQHYLNANKEPKNFGAYVDYSTSPQYHETTAPFIITDISGTMSRFFMFQQMLPLYRLFPLHEIVEMLLSHSVEDESPGTSEYFIEETEQRLGSVIETIDIDGLFLFYEQLLMSLDEEIWDKANSCAKDLRYTFYKWVDPVSLCLCNDKHLRAKAFPHLVQNPRYENTRGRYGIR